MSKYDRPIHYEPHPVSPERKAELIGEGFRIIDAKFAPPGAVESEALVAEAVVRRKPGRKPKAA